MKTKPQVLILILVLFFCGCAINEAITSRPSEAFIYWGKTKDKITKTIHKTPFQRPISGGNIESWCYQVKKSGYYPSDVTCFPIQTESRNVDFVLKPQTKIQKESKISTIYYTRCNLKVIKGTYVTWINYQSVADFIPVGTAVKVNRNGSEAKLTNVENGKTYTLDIGSNDPVFFEKFITEKPFNIDEYPKEVQFNIGSAVAGIGMTKEQVYMAMGPPVVVGSVKTYNKTYEEIMDANLWIYKRRRFGKNIGIAFDPFTGFVNRTEGIWRESKQIVHEEKKVEGTGFAISSTGTLVTAYHVVKGSAQIYVKFSKWEWIPAKLVRYSQIVDTAILQIQNSPPACLSLKSTNTLKAGDTVFTIGYPVTEMLGSEAKYTDGKISALSGFKGDQSLIQITVPVQPGNSGGPLVTLDGHVVGLITSSAHVAYFYNRTGALPQNINWAIKADYILPMLKEEEINCPATEVNDYVEMVSKSICLVKTE